MTPTPEYPRALDNDFYQVYAKRLCNSFQYLLGCSLLGIGGGQAGNKSLVHALYDAPFPIVAHGVEADPLFNFANCAAQTLFEYSWDQFIGLPSRQSAEPVLRAERQQLLDAVNSKGYIDSYQGVRIASSGKRFFIEKAIVWNVQDEQQQYCGQAAALYAWRDMK